MNNNDQDIELIKQTNTLSDNNQTAKNHPEKPHSFKQKNEQDKDINPMEKHINITINDSSTSNRSPETSEVIFLTTAVSLNV